MLYEHLCDHPSSKRLFRPLSLNYLAYDAACVIDHRVLLPGCALAGASALLLADIVARLALAAAELPIGVVTATLGAPVFIWLLLKAGR